MPTLFYRKSGKGQPVILIHGFCETHEIWNDFAESLSKQFEVYILDLPGFGQSQLPPSPFSIEDIAIIICDWIDQMKISSPVVIGHSLGGYVTLAMAAKHPGKFAAIGLFHSTAYPDSEERKANRNKVIEFVKEHGVDPFIDAFVPGLFLDKKHVAIPTVDAITRKTSQQTLLAYTTAMRDRTSYVDFLKTFAKPVLILAGEGDGVIPVETIYELGRITPGAVMCILKATGHMAMYESPTEAKRAVIDFIRATPDTISRD